MKLPLFLAALFLCSSPAFADGMVYLECDTTIVQTAKKRGAKRDLASYKASEVIYYKLDTINGRFISIGEWNDVTIANGVASDQIDVVENGVTMRGEFSLQFSPPGKIFIDHAASEDDVLLRAVLKGTCQDSDRETVEKGIAKAKKS